MSAGPRYRCSLAACLAFLTFAGSVPAFAQSYEQVGVRAMGMGGAFVAVADDATAIYWNPAGFATGDYLGGLLEHQRRTMDEDVFPGRRGSATLFALGMPALGLGYYRLVSVSVTGAPPTSTAVLEAIRVRTDNFGISLLQSLGDHFVVGTTLRGGSMEVGLASSPAGTSQSDLASQAARAPQLSRRLFDADVGVMAKFGNVRLGTTFRNLRAPSLDLASGARARLQRHARAGVAIFPTDGWTLAADVDLTSDEGPRERRMAAVGAQHLLGSRRLVALRTGARFSLEGDASPSWSVGTSLPIRSGTWLDGQLTLGSQSADHSWGVSARVGF